MEGSSRSSTLHLGKRLTPWRNRWRWKKYTWNGNGEDLNSGISNDTQLRGLVQFGHGLLVPWGMTGPDRLRKGGARQGGIFVWQTPRVCCFMLPSPCFFVKRLRIVVVGWSPMATDACGWTAGSGQQTVNIDARVAQAGGDPVSSMLCICKQAGKSPSSFIHSLIYSFIHSSGYPPRYLRKGAESRW